MTEKILAIVKKHESLAARIKERKKQQIEEIRELNAERFDELSDDFEDFERA